MMTLLIKLRSLDWMMLSALVGMLLLSFTALYSIGLGRGDSFYFQHQLVALSIGSGGMIILALLNYRVFKNAALPLYGGMLLLLIAVLFFGEKIRGTRGWFFLGDFGFQPVELAKLILILNLARYFDSWTRQIGRFRTIFFSGMLNMIPLGLILLQPDFGSAVIIFGIWLSMLLVSGIPKRFIITLGLVIVAAAVCAWLFLFQDYQKDRITSFLFPRTDQQGAGYNIRQALIAIGGGQLFGTGIGEGSGSRLRFLPEAQTDFIFAVIAEELGFIGVFALMLFFLLFFYRCILLLRRAEDDFASYIIFGVIIILFSQVAINIGGNLGLIPITGLVLPFISYGGSALVISFALIGLLQSIRIHSSYNSGKS